MTKAEEMHQLANKGADRIYKMILKEIEEVANNKQLSLNRSVVEGLIGEVAELLIKDGFVVSRDSYSSLHITW